MDGQTNNSLADCTPLHNQITTHYCIIRLQHNIALSNYTPLHYHITTPLHYHITTHHCIIRLHTIALSDYNKPLYYKITHHYTIRLQHKVGKYHKVLKDCMLCAYHVQTWKKLQVVQAALADISYSSANSPQK